jgi:hypothetical protein
MIDADAVPRAVDVVHKRRRLARPAVIAGLIGCGLQVFLTLGCAGTTVQSVTTSSFATTVLEANWPVLLMFSKGG